MQMRPHLQIQAIIKAITEDVIPALDATNQLAMQSAQLTIGTLMLIAQHLPLEYRFDCDELSRLIDAAGMLNSQIEGTPASAAGIELTAAGNLGRDVLSRARAEPAEIIEAVHRLRTASAAAVKAVYVEGSHSAQEAVQKTVLAMSKQQLLRDRSWLLMQGWEPDPKSVPAIGDLLSSKTSA